MIASGLKPGRSYHARGAGVKLYSLQPATANGKRAGRVYLLRCHDTRRYLEEPWAVVFRLCGSIPFTSLLLCLATQRPQYAAQVDHRQRGERGRNPADGQGQEPAVERCLSGRVFDG